MKSKTEGLEPHTEFLWSREDYEELVRQEILGPEDRLELLDGKLITMAPQRSPHYTAINLTSSYLRQVFTEGGHVRVQGPVNLDPMSQPEPDLAVVPGAIRDYTESHPSSAILLVEVAETSVRYDRGPKLRAYARAGIPEYWIVNLIDRQVEVYRHPDGEAFAETFTVRPGAPVHPIGHAARAIDAAELLP